MGAADLFQILVSGFTVGGVYALMALGFHIVYASARILNFAHGVIVVIGGLLALTLITSLHLNFFVVLFLIVIAGWLIGVLFNRAIIVSIKDLGPGIQIICLLAVNIVFENVAALIWGKEPLPFPPFPGGDSPFRVGPVYVLPQSLWVIGLTIVGLAATQIVLRRTLIGKAIRATANNPTAARLVGISPRRTYSVALGIALSLGALAGMVISPLTFAGGPLAIPLTIKGFTAAVMGGLLSSTGAIAGGFLLGILESTTAGLVTTSYLNAVTMSLLLVILLVRPQGLFASGRE